MCKVDEYEFKMSVTDPRDGKRVALKKMPNVFQNLVSCKRVFRELKMLCFFKHDNVLSALDILQPPHIDYFEEMYPKYKIILIEVGVIDFRLQIICDFGLARVEELDESRHMTQEVVTQYYRAPEILMGSRHYSNAIDIWSVGCIFAELLGRRILFQAQSPIQQLDLITDLLGTPSLEAMRTACEGAKAHILRGPHKQPSLPVLYTLSSQATHEAVHLLCRMLVFDPSKRISAKDALAHPYLDEGRLRYHTCMCKCCFSTSTGRVYTSDFEPITNPKFDDTFEKNLSSVRQVKADFLLLHCPREGMAAVTGLLEWVFALYFLTHIPITLLIDLQALVPGAGIHPQSLTELLKWYAVTFKDPMMLEPPAWFKSFVYCEAFLQMPFFPIAAYAFLKGAKPKTCSFKEGSLGNKYVRLNVGGSLYYTTVQVLTRHDTMLKAMFSGRMEVLTDKEGWILIDRCGKHFGVILNYLRDDTIALPKNRQEIKELMAEAKYYLIQGLVDMCQAALQDKKDSYEPVCNIPIITSPKEEERLIESSMKPVVKLLYNRSNNKYSYTSNSDDNLLKNIELFDKLSLRFNGRVLFIKDVIGDEICCWSFYGQGRKLAEVCCTSIVYATEKKQTKVEFPEARIYEETLNVLLYETPRVPDNSLLEATSRNRSQASHSEDDEGFELRDRVRRIHVKRYSTYDDRQLGH
ncbi:BTB/POZ domain-containing adapter for CUL3-mediated RhoA degradation protein 2 [Chelonia mydas]|uniref:BTB/POZ domain-containing adapter for CUL3-mediated RhoA degradation protein 2 n=1 Tax=Chelonia mydas TaxID=8469 RepID=M7BIE2_CHEMY|nr:BTB/POZ domain-containing adapter for CUL3-mediated RhoA degradation protein 2 [Chelonia mydas]